ncbi:Acyl-coenzyme A:6-aminopenicillanic acid acyl-transferase [Natronincola peptidivorans]|uniref:Acyl-coenzyme A:6-aminopenicillanic acid acyl-transferase n=1 Tax=Natronincola peptidivorans TaxID=426128 RepID=A0A1I0A3A4_9FIRM|nr:C45 family autoproteolytic acyltransferase/hydolase [Natronincola peptidivorans]SES88549.1 Acyl-coenzyme A:6-aminopenicillanic acid acyl-transferase [Natronincola peptidivorans]
MLDFHERVILSSPEDSLEVRHLVLKGSNYEIGKKLGEIAKEVHGIEKKPSEDLLQTRCQRIYLEKNYPIYLERMKGTAATYNKDLSKDAVDFSLLGELALDTGCSAVYYPPNSTASGHGIISRNLDFYMPSKTPAFSKPYIVEMYPDEGYPSITILSFQLLGEALEGINSEGLTVIHLADDESAVNHSIEPTFSNAVGINELKSVQLLLDTCATVEEAKEVLLTNKHFYIFQPIHLLIADRFGNSFVWEYSHAHNKEYIVDRKEDTPQIVTNFLLHRYEAIEVIPKTSEDKICPYNRYRVLHDAIEDCTEKFTIDFTKKTNALVFVEETSYMHPPEIPVRTLLHNIYDIDDRSIEISFYLRDGANHRYGTSIRTPYYEFSIKNQ